LEVKRKFGDPLPSSSLPNFIEAHSGGLGDNSIYRQESNYTTWRLAKMNLVIRGIDAQIAHGAPPSFSTMR
jgi:type I restriction-modification system DNA methylase subunit